MEGKTRALIPLLLLMEDIAIELEIKTETERDQGGVTARGGGDGEEQSL